MSRDGNGDISGNGTGTGVAIVERGRGLDQGAWPKGGVVSKGGVAWAHSLLGGGVTGGVAQAGGVLSAGLR